MCMICISSTIGVKPYSDLSDTLFKYQTNTEAIHLHSRKRHRVALPAVICSAHSCWLLDKRDETLNIYKYCVYQSIKYTLNLQKSHNKYIYR